MKNNNSKRQKQSNGLHPSAKRLMLLAYSAVLFRMKSLTNWKRAVGCEGERWFAAIIFLLMRSRNWVIILTYTLGLCAYISEIAWIVCVPSQIKICTNWIGVFHRNISLFFRSTLRKNDLQKKSPIFCILMPSYSGFSNIFVRITLFVVNYNPLQWHTHTCKRLNTQANFARTNVSIH